jgi:hypothetical protein
MKSKLFVVVSALALLVLVWLAKPRPGTQGPATTPGAREPSDEPSTGQTVEANMASLPTVNTAGPGTNGPILEANGAIQDARNAPNQSDASARCGELLELSMNNDSASLDVILGELRNPDPAIRQAAVVAALQFGSRDAIPRLMETAQETEDGNERTNILEAIEFLKMPSLSEMISQKPRPAAER